MPQGQSKEPNTQHFRATILNIRTMHSQWAAKNSGLVRPLPFVLDQFKIVNTRVVSNLCWTLIFLEKLE